MILAQTASTVALEMPFWLKPDELLQSFGPYVIVGLCLVIFIESCIFPVLPGDSLLFMAGLFIARGSIDDPLWLVCALVSAAAVIGNVLGYYIGVGVGPRLFNRPDSKIFKQEHVDKTHEFLERHGPKAVVLARFVPFVRTFITWIAGIGRMDAKKYLSYTVLGGILWAGGITALGYLLGGIPFIRDHVEAILVLVVLVSIIPLIVEWAKSRKAKRAAKTAGE